MNQIENIKSENLNIKELYKQIYIRKNGAAEYERKGDVLQAILIYQSILKAVEHNSYILKKSSIWYCKKSERQMKEMIEMYCSQAKSKILTLCVSIKADPELFGVISNGSFAYGDSNSNFLPSGNINHCSREIGEYYFSFLKKIQRVSSFQKHKDVFSQSIRVSNPNKGFFFENLFKNKSFKKEIPEEHYQRTRRTSQPKQFPQTLRQAKSRSSLVQNNAGKAALYAWNSGVNSAVHSLKTSETNGDSPQRLNDSTIQLCSSLFSTSYKTSLNEYRTPKAYPIPGEFQSNDYIDPYINKNDMVDESSGSTLKQHSIFYKPSTHIPSTSIPTSDLEPSSFTSLYHTSQKNISITSGKSIQKNSSLNFVSSNTLSKDIYGSYKKKYNNVSPVKDQKHESEITLHNNFKNISLNSQNRIEKTNIREKETREQRAINSLKNIIDENLLQTIINDIVFKGDEVLWEDIAGLEEAKNTLKETVIYPLLRPDLFSGLREPATGVLLFGPPGTGKTMLAKAAATQAKSTFFSISASSLMSKFLGESEKLVRALFALAKELSPSIIFVDEIDALLSSRREDGNEHEASRRLKTEFLIQWSSLATTVVGKVSEPIPRVLVLAATNIPWSIDEAARRRFVRRQYIPLPERSTRMQQILYLLKYQTHTLSNEDIESLVDITEGYSGSDITALTKDAAMGPLRSLGEALLTTRQDLIRPICIDDFKASLRSIRPSVSQKGLIEFEKFNKEFGIQS
ncbi:hypothetical protein PMAC_003327 [Pneumocystis sp. 'macacae']|nr:hypothetical protein PMAC_003327 [Pneumocystis sp. 'macacae']